MRVVIWTSVVLALAVTVDRLSFESRFVQAAALMAGDMKEHFFR